MTTPMTMVTSMRRHRSGTRFSTRVGAMMRGFEAQEGGGGRPRALDGGHRYRRRARTARHYHEARSARWIAEHLPSDVLRPWHAEAPTRSRGRIRGESRTLTAFTRRRETDLDVSAAPPARRRLV